MKRGPLLMLLLLTLMVIALPVGADEGVQVSLTASQQELTVGDPVQLTLVVTHPAGYQVIVPQLDPVWGDFEVRRQSPATTTVNDNGTATTRQTIEVTLFRPGDFVTPELPLTISDGAGHVMEAVAPSVSLTVTPTLTEEDNELRDLKPQAALSVPPLWPWVLGGLLLAGAAGAAGWWAFRRWRGKPFGRAAVVDNRPAWQVALDELARIESLGLLEQGRFKEYYSLITDCLRAYLEGQFDLRALERTTSELKAALRQSDLEPEPVRQLLALFAESDLVKFAKFTPQVPAARQAMARAQAFVDQTRPQPEAGIDEFLAPGNPSATPPRFSYQAGR